MKLRKTTATLLIATFMISTFAVSAIAKKDKDYATIQDGTITYGRVDDPSIEIIPIGYDQWGYNYQAHLFNGWYWNNLRPDVPWTEETLIAAGKSTTWLIMKWSDTWLSNMDRDGDTKLDRGYPYPTTSEPLTYTSSAAPGAWVTNHQFGEYEEDGKIYKWNYFVKIAHPGVGAVKVDDIWYTEDDIEIGPAIWGAYAIIQQVYNDQGTGEHGIEYLSPACAGLGAYK